MKKSILAIILVGAGITFASAQKKETTKMQKAAKVETLQKAQLQAEMKAVDSMSAESVEVKAVDQQKAEEMEVKKAEEAKAAEETLNVQKAKKESIE